MLARHPLSLFDASSLAPGQKPEVHFDPSRSCVPFNRMRSQGQVPIHGACQEHRNSLLCKEEFIHGAGEPAMHTSNDTNPLHVTIHAERLVPLGPSFDMAFT